MPEPLDPRIRDLLDEVDLTDGATPEAIRQAASALPVELPADLVALLASSNGVDGPIGDGWVILWPVEELAAKNVGYQVTTRLPGMLLIGTDGGGEAFAIGYEDGEPRYYVVPFVPLERDHAAPAGSTLEAFLIALRDVSW